MSASSPSAARARDRSSAGGPLRPDSQEAFTGAARADGTCPPPVLAAAALTAEGVSLLLVGSGALWLRGEQIPVGDADVVIEPGQQNIGRLSNALARMALRPLAVPPARHFSWLPLITVTTSFGGVDCLLERGRFDWERLRQGAETIAVADAGVLVAGRADAWALRRQFRQ